jgi:gamma-glutamylcyclotransferase (GGCT)/AIG2-like uncharacterized protein YtfP
VSHLWPHLPQEISQRLFLHPNQPLTFAQPILLLCNQPGENFSSGKTVIAASVAQASVDEEDYDSVIWIQDPDFTMDNVEVFYQHLIKKLKKLHNLTYQFPDIHQIRARSSHHYENVLLDLLAFDKQSKHLLVIDNLVDFSVLPAIKVLGIPTLITSRVRPNDFDGVVIEVSRFDENGVDVMTARPQRFSPPEGSLSSAYLLGANQREMSFHSPGKNTSNLESMYEPTLPLLLHAHLYCCVSPQAARMYSSLRCLPVNIFVPSRLISFIWKPWLSDGEEQTVLEELVNYSLLHSCATLQSVMLSPDSKSVLEVFCLPYHMSHKNQIHTELPTLVEVSARLFSALSTVDSFLSLGLDQHTNCLIPLFDFLGWGTQDLIQLYDPLLLSLLEETFEILVAERFLKSLFEAFDGTQLRSQLSEVGSLDSRDRMLIWIAEWTHRFVDRIYTPSTDIQGLNHLQGSCSMLNFHATICELCHNGDEAIAMRKGVVEYQRSFSGDVKLPLGVALLSLGRSIFIAHSSGSGKVYGRGDNEVGGVMESVARMAVKCLAQSDPSTSLGDCSLVFLVDVLELVGANQEELVSLLETVLKLRNKFHESLLHPRISAIYCRLSQIQFRERLWNEALQSLSKSIRINRTLFGESHYFASDLIDMLADFHATLAQLKVHVVQEPLSSSRNRFGHSLSSFPSLSHSKNVLGKKSRDSEERSSSSKKTVGTLDDVAILIALAERITKKGDYCKSRKYLVKALQFISEIMSHSESSQITDPTLPLVFKWSAYHKLGELNELEGEPIRAMKFYHRSFKGFLELSVLDSEKELQHLEEAMVVVFRLSTLVELVKGFHEAFPLYFELLMILSDLYPPNTNTRLSKSPDLHVAITEHLQAVILQHQADISHYLKLVTSTTYQNPNNLFDLSLLRLDSSGKEFVDRFLKLSDEIHQVILPPGSPHTSNSLEERNLERLQQTVAQVEVVDVSLFEQKEEEKVSGDDDVLMKTVAPSAPLREFIPPPPKPLARPKKDQNQRNSFVSMVFSLDKPRQETPPAESPSEKHWEISPDSPIPSSSVASSPSSPPLRRPKNRRRGPRAIHLFFDDFSEVSAIPTSDIPDEKGQHLCVTLPAVEERKQFTCGTSESEPETAPPDSNRIHDINLDSHQELEPFDQHQQTPRDSPVPGNSEGQEMESPAAASLVCLEVSNGARTSDDLARNSPQATEADVELPRQPRLSRQVSIKEIQEECTKFINFFVFGSLRRHQENHSLLSMPNRDESFSYLGTTTTVHSFYLYINCTTGLPIVTEEPIETCKSTVTTIVGEVYSVTPSIVERTGALFPDSTLVNVDLKSFGGNLEENVAVMYLAIEPSIIDWMNVPRGNYSQFLSTRGGLQAFLTETAKKHRRKSIHTADLEKLTKTFNERKNPKERRKFKIWD